MSSSFDRQATLERVGNDRNLLSEIVELFCADAPPRLFALGEAIERGDLEAARAAAHALKGGVSMFAAPGAHAAADRVEELASRGDPKALRSGYRELEAEYLRLCRDLESFARQGPGRTS